MKKIVGLLIIGMIMTSLLISCGGSKQIAKVKDGYLDAFGSEVTIGEVFDTISTKSTKWSQDELNDNRWSNDDYLLVQAELSLIKKLVIVIQFIVEKDGNNFFMLGGYMQGEDVSEDFQEAETVIEFIIDQYNN